MKFCDESSSSRIRSVAGWHIYVEAVGRRIRSAENVIAGLLPGIVPQRLWCMDGQKHRLWPCISIEMVLKLEEVGVRVDVWCQQGRGPIRRVFSRKSLLRSLARGAGKTKNRSSSFSGMQRRKV